MKSRVLALFVVFVLLIGMLPVAVAQDDAAAKLNCLNLSDADCKTVEAGNTSLQNITSAKPTFSVDFALSGAATLTGGSMADMSASASGSGSFVLDHAAMTKDAPYLGVNAAFDLSGQANMSGKDQSGSFSVALVDGVAYWKDPDSGKWQGVAVADVMKALASADLSSMMSSIPGFSMFGGMMNPAMMQGMMQGAGQNPDQTLQNANVGGEQLMALLQIPGFLKQERLDDATLDGQTMQVFAFTGDIGTLMQSPEVQKAIGDAMSSAMASQAGSGSTDQTSSMMASMMPILLQSTTGTVTVTRWIGADDGFYHKVELKVDAKIDLNSPTPNSKVTPLPPITLTLNASLQLADINDTAAPTAPEGATMLKAEDLFPAVTPEATP